MPDESLLTLRQLAQELGLPESTVRYYRDAFLDHIPSVGTGRRRRYPREAVGVLREIAKRYASGHTRNDIATGMHGPRSAATATVAVTESRPAPAQIEEVSNLDLLAAILDGEREQRDALWQMANEIMHLSEVLEGQDRILTGIADKAGIVIAPRAMPATIARPAALQSPASAAPAAPAEPAPATGATPANPLTAPPPPVAPLPGSGAMPPVAERSAAATVQAQPFTPPQAPRPSFADTPAPASSPAPAPAPSPAPAPLPERFAAAQPATPDIEKLRAELESERALVERLREAKLQLEHRAADAEAALSERSGRRPSVIRRLLGADEQA